MKFAAEYMLLFLLAIPALVGFFIWSSRRRRRALALFADQKLLPHLRPAGSDRRRFFKTVLITVALFFLILVLSRPQFGSTLEEVKRKGIDVVIALDTSRSMLAEDIKPNRLEKAKTEIAGLLELLSGDRVAIMAFAGEPFVLCPLTLDYNAARMFLEIMDTDTIPTHGTAIASAIQEARKVFDPAERKHKVLILLTDGEDHRGDPVKAAEQAAEEGLIIHTVGVGTPGGEFIPELDQDGKVLGYKKDRAGELVRSQLDEMTLEKVALISDGKYFRASYDEMELKKIFEELSGMEKKDLKSQMVIRYKDRYQWLLLPIIALLFIEQLIPERGRRPRPDTKDNRQ